MFNLTILELAQLAEASDSPAAEEIKKHLARINTLYKELPNED